uniref:Uncharacterized protein n=2 Tax=Acrobeloides nanus TaxID=290746 RepID=A0A914EED8_9BILA
MSRNRPRRSSHHQVITIATNNHKQDFRARTSKSFDDSLLKLLPSLFLQDSKMSSSEYSMGLRSFLVPNDDPLNVNRLKLIDRRTGQAETKYLLNDSASTHNASTLSGIIQNGRTNSSVISRMTTDDLETEPSTSRSAPIYSNGNIRKGSITSNRSVHSIKQRALASKTASKDQENGEEKISIASDRAADNEVSETLDGSPYNEHKMRFVVPNKWEVLFYIANVQYLRIRRTGTELQVTDSVNFPLFDVWQKERCFRSAWVMESYGRPVLLISDDTKNWSLASRKSSPLILSVVNADGDLLGYFLAGNPFIVQNNEKSTIAKFVAYDSEDGRSTNWQCILEGSDDDIAVLECLKPAIYQLRFCSVMGFPLKLLVLGGAVMLAAAPRCQKECCCTIM